MFGIFYMLYCGVVGIVGKTRDVIEDGSKKDKAVRMNDFTYYDSHNQLRMVSNDRQVYITTDNNNHKVVKDLFNGTVYKDITKERERWRIGEAKSSGNTVITDYHIWKNVKNYTSKHWYQCHALPCYKDIETGKLYKDVRINGIRFYMDVESGYIVRPLDGEDLSNVMNRVSIPAIIKIFNNRQDKIKQDDKIKQSWWAESYYYLNDYYVEVTNDGNIIERNR